MPQGSDTLLRKDDVIEGKGALLSKCPCPDIKSHAYAYNRCNKIQFKKHVCHRDPYRSAYH